MLLGEKMKKEKLKFDEKYFKIQKEFKSKQWKKSQLEKYILNIQAEKVKSETIIKLVEIGTVPLSLSFLSFILSLTQFKIVAIILILLIFIIMTLSISFIIIYKCKKSIFQIEMIIDLANKIINKK